MVNLSSSHSHSSPVHIMIVLVVWSVNGMAVGGHILYTYIHTYNSHITDHITHAYECACGINMIYLKQNKYNMGLVMIVNKT